MLKPCYNLWQTSKDSSCFENRGTFIKPLKELRQPAHIILAKNSNTLTFTIISNFYNNLYLHYLRPCCENIFKMSSFKEKWEINLTI